VAALQRPATASAREADQDGEQGVIAPGDDI
jgi:hypothetical protein